MKTYITKPTRVKKSQIMTSGFSLSSMDFINLKTNSNSISLRDLMNNFGKGKDFEEVQFVQFETKYKYLKTGCLTSDNFLVNDNPTSYEFIKPNDYKEFHNSKRAIKKYDILYTSTGSNNRIGDCALANEDLENSYSSHIFKLNLKNNTQNFYIFAILKSSYGKESCDLLVPKAGIMRRGGDRFLDIQIPFPTIANHLEPQQVQDLVSVLVQDIIDKEEQIKAKNQRIDQLIETELKDNQKNNTFNYKLPKISEIKREGRMDTGLYDRKYKDISNLIQNYSKGFYFLDQKKIKPGQTPGDYIFADYQKNSQFKSWITPKNIDGRTLSFKTYIRTKANTKVTKNSLIVNGIRYVGNGILADQDSLIFCNQNTLIINQFGDQIKQSSLLCFLTSKFGKAMQLVQRNFGIVPILYAENLCRVPIPDFPELKQIEIAKEYYNQVHPNQNLTLENYLELEKQRNLKLGIFQLNMEIFDLRNKLEEIVDRIVNEQPVDIFF